MLKKLGDAYTQRVNLEEAWQHYRKALQLITNQNPGKTAETAPEDGGDRRHLLVLYEHLALLAMRWLGHFDTPPDMLEVRGYIDAGLRLLEGTPLSREHAVFHTHEAFWYIRQLIYAPGEQKAALMEQALSSGQHALHQAEELNDPHTLSLALDAISFAYERYRRYDKALNVQQRRMQLEQQLTERAELYDLYCSLGWVATQVADYRLALESFGRAWSIAQTMESPRMLRFSLIKRMQVWYYWNRWDEAKRAAHETLHLVEKYQMNERHQLWALETLARIAYHRGDQEEGDRLAKRCRRLVDKQVEQAPLDARKQIALRMRLLHYACGNLERALAEHKELLAITEPLPEPEALAILANLLVQSRKEPEQQLAICERAIAMSELSDARKGLAVALRARGEMYIQRQNWERAEQDLQQALQLCEEIDLPWEQAHTLSALGTLYQERAASTIEIGPHSADAGRARDHFERALGFYEALHAMPMVEQVRQRLQQGERSLAGSTQKE